MMRDVHYCILASALLAHTLAAGPGTAPPLRRIANTTLHLPAAISNDAPLPPTLAETGAFQDLVQLTPNAGIIPYEVNVPLWSDGAHKARWFCLADTNVTINFERESPWAFPPGAVWIKHFELELINGVPDSARRIETRFLVRNAAGFYGVTYRWDESQTNAFLVPSEGLDEDIDIEDQGETHTQTWRYPSREECLKCHTAAAGAVLGFNTWQLNREFDYRGGKANQIAALNEAGYFSSNVTGINTLRALAAATNTGVSLEYRVRSYLAANCAQCHQPGTDCLARWDARITNPTAAAGIINGPLVYPFLALPRGRVIVPNSLENSIMLHRISNLNASHMPPLATTVVNTDAVTLLSAWITNGLSRYQSFADWQSANFNSSEIPTAAAGADPDRDGSVNELEYLLGTDPLSPDKPWTWTIEREAGLVRIRLLRLANRGFEIQQNDDLRRTDGWMPLDDPDNRPFFSSTDVPAVIDDPIQSIRAKFYRVRVFTP
jgi:uncharacterized repeat protein (TIGR03806 family)